MVLTTKFNCEKHEQQEFKICDCDPDLDKCLFCLEEEAKNDKPQIALQPQSQPPSNRHCFIFLINTAVNDRNAFPVVSFIEDTQESSIFNVLAKSQDEGFMIYEYSGVVALNSREFLITGGQVVQGTTKDVYILRFELIGQVYLYVVERLSDLLNERYSHKAFSINQKFIVAGGLDQDKKALKSCEIYEKNVWNKGPELNKARSQASGFSHGGFLYIFGGFLKTKIQETTFERLDAKELAKWEEIKLKVNESIHLAACHCLDYKNGVLLLGGSNGKTASSGVFFWDIEKEEIVKRKEIMKFERANAVGTLVENNKVLVLGGEKDSVVRLELIGLVKEGQSNTDLDEEEDQKCPFNEPGYFWFQLK